MPADTVGAAEAAARATNHLGKSHTCPWKALWSQGSNSSRNPKSNVHRTLDFSNLFNRIGFWQGLIHDRTWPTFQ